MFYLYILKSEKSGSYYVGTTNNVEKRLKLHNNGKVQSTKWGRPWFLIHKESFETLSQARKRESHLKSLKRKTSLEKGMEHF